MGPLRVAHLTATFPPYWAGTGTVAFHQAQELARRGHRVEVFTGTAGDADPDGVTVHRIDPVFAIGNAPLLPPLARLRGFDVVHFHHPFIFGTELTMLARLRWGDTALVATHHNRLVGSGGRLPLFWAYEETVARTLIRVADRVCVFSRTQAATVNYLRSGMRRRPERFAEVPNGVDTEAFAPGPDDAKIRERLGIATGATMVAFIAALDRAHHFKRLDLALGAVARLDGVHLLVIGGGDLTDSWRSRAAEMGMAERTHFAGAQPHGELPRWLRAADALVLPSDIEAFPLVLLEAMATGLPVVATHYPGAHAIVEPSGAGLVARRGDLDDVTARLREVLEPGARERFGAAGRDYCVRNLGWPAIADRLERIYAAAIARRTATKRA